MSMHIILAFKQRLVDWFRQLKAIECTALACLIVLDVIGFIVFPIFIRVFIAMCADYGVFLPLPMRITAEISSWGILLAPLVAGALLANELYVFAPRDWFRLIFAIALVILLVFLPLSVILTVFSTYGNGPVGH